MTGRELIMYILENHLEDSDVFEDGSFLDCLTEEEAAVKLGVGTATIRTWIEHGKMHAISLGDSYYIPNELGTLKDYISRKE